MILSKEDILMEIKNKRIVVSSFSKSSVGPASIDLTLDNKFRVFKQGFASTSEGCDYKKFTRLVKKNSIVLYPGQFVLGITKEKICLPADLCGWLTGRSRFARLGLQVHSTAAFLQPGINNHQVLELYNLSCNPLELRAGSKVCQLVIEKCSGKVKYSGKFMSQSL